MLGKIVRSKSQRLLTLLFVLTAAAVAKGQYFGKNKVQYRDFDWKYVQSKHFDVYYYGEEKALAEFTVEVAESSYVHLIDHLQYRIAKRIPILVYNSHNEFQQTNVINSLIEESVGGFTEVFKDRIVVPFQGNYNEYRHVVHHELTHAVMFQMMYGGGVGSMVSAMTRLNIPLWVAEGLAEFESIGWDTESDMFMRDATINNYVPPIPYLNGFMAYKGGQSVMHYVAEKYGRPKIGEILGKIKTTRNIDEGVKSAIGLEMEDFTKRWHKYLQKKYWPDIKDRDEPEDFAKRLTDHAKNRHFLNNSPSLSPNGDRLVYLSNRSDYIDIYIMSTVDEKKKHKLVKGQRSDLFEELHWLRPGIGWSPDGKKIVFTAKAGSEDALYILDMEERKIVQSYKLDMDGLYNPDWSPDGRRIVFMGLDGGQSDLYLFDVETGDVEALTQDMFSDMEPAWSPDGKEIAFVSDRLSFTRQPDGLKMHQHEFQQTDLYTMNVETREINRYTFDEAEEKSPKYSPDGSKIAYISDKTGISNIYILDKENYYSYPITNLLTGASQISWSREGSRLAFSSFFDGGYDLYLLTNPLDIEPGSVKVEDTAFMAAQKEKKLAAVKEKKETEPSLKQPANSFRNYVFGLNFKRGEVNGKKSPAETFLDSTVYKDSHGEYRTKKYKLRFTADALAGGAGYSQFYGLQGSSMIILSDILGNHQINIYTDVFYNLKNSNFQLAYYYLPKRTDYGISLFHFSYPYYTYFVEDGVLKFGFIRDRNYGMVLNMSRPFNRFQRIDMGLTALAIERDLVGIDIYGYYYGYQGSDIFKEKGNLYKRQVLMMNLGYKTDTVLWGMTGPVNGSRSSLAFSYSPSISKKYGLDFWTAKLDWRKYFRIKRDYTFVMRMAGGLSGGKNPQRFLLGGMPNWMNYKYRRLTAADWGNSDFYFSTLETPLRGSVYYEQLGTRYMLANLEFRFPLVQYLILGWPLPIGFQNIRGALFFDMGSAWDNDEKWEPIQYNANGFFKFKDMIGGYGIGARMNVGFFLLKYDIAWKTDLNIHVKKPIHYFTLGAEF